MRDVFIENIIKGFISFYGYGVIEVDKSLGITSNWALIKTLNYDCKRVVIFLNNSKGFNYEHTNVQLRKALNVASIQLIRIIIVDSSELNNSNEIIYEEDAITVDCTSNKLLGYGYKCNETAEELFNVLSYNSNKSEDRSENHKPWITYILMFTNLIMYIITAILSGDPFDSDINVLVLMGANYNELISAGQYYRLFTSMFLHGGIMHVVLNMYALNSIGPLVEKIYGRVKYLLIYFISGIISSLLSFKFSDGVSIGASGAIFGLLGTILVFAITKRKDLGRNFLKNILSVISINLFIGFTIPNIDNFGHIGGLIGGVAASAILNFEAKK